MEHSLAVCVIHRHGHVPHPARCQPGSQWADEAHAVDVFRRIGEGEGGRVGDSDGEEVAAGAVADLVSREGGEVVGGVRHGGRRNAAIGAGLNDWLHEVGSSDQAARGGAHIGGAEPAAVDEGGKLHLEHGHGLQVGTKGSAHVAVGTGTAGIP